MPPRRGQPRAHDRDHPRSRHAGRRGCRLLRIRFPQAANELADGNDLQEALVAAAGDMPIVGPNCYGFINMLDGALLWPDQHGMLRVERGVAILTQSSNIACNISMQKRGLPLAYVMTAGNQAQTGLSDIACAVLEDPRVTAVGLHIEGFDSIEAWKGLPPAPASCANPWSR